VNGPAGTAIEVQGLTKQYAGATVVRDVSFSVEHGEIFGIIGPNGDLVLGHRHHRVVVPAVLQLPAE
jgi:ABC-type phosphonate transport system ATPase subunit